MVALEVVNLFISLSTISTENFSNRNETLFKVRELIFLILGYTEYLTTIWSVGSMISLESRMKFSFLILLREPVIVKR